MDSRNEEHWKMIEGSTGVFVVDDSFYTICKDEQRNDPVKYKTMYDIDTLSFFKSLPGKLEIKTTDMVKVLPFLYVEQEAGKEITYLTICGAVCTFQVHIEKKVPHFHVQFKGIMSNKPIDPVFKYSIDPEMLFQKIKLPSLHLKPIENIDDGLRLNINDVTFNPIGFRFTMSQNETPLKFSPGIKRHLFQLVTSNDKVHYTMDREMLINFINNLFIKLDITGPRNTKYQMMVDRSGDAPLLQVTSNVDRQVVFEAWMKGFDQPKSPPEPKLVNIDDLAPKMMITIIDPEFDIFNFTFAMKTDGSWLKFELDAHGYPITIKPSDKNLRYEMSKKILQFLVSKQVGLSIHLITLWDEIYQLDVRIKQGTNTLTIRRVPDRAPMIMVKCSLNYSMVEDDMQPEEDSLMETIHIDRSGILINTTCKLLIENVEYVLEESPDGKYCDPIFCGKTTGVPDMEINDDTLRLIALAGIGRELKIILNNRSVYQVESVHRYHSGKSVYLLNLLDNNNIRILSFVIPKQ